MSNIYITVLIIIGLYGAVISDDWSYWGEHDPAHWPGLCTSGKKQSPINVATEDTIKTDLGPLKFVGYDFVFAAKIMNDGHSVQIKLHRIPIYLEGADLPSPYILGQIHFHWPAEHTVDDNRDVLELHLVHYNEKYDNTSFAAQHENGIAVVAILYQLSAEDSAEIAAILKASELIGNRVGKSAAFMASKFSPHLLLPKDHTTYYRYDGSLTTPGCQESVMWFILTEKLSVSENQINAFKKIVTNNGTLVFNNRPTQPLGERKIYHHLIGYSSATSHRSVLFYIFFAILWNRLSFSILY